MGVMRNGVGTKLLYSSSIPFLSGCTRWGRQRTSTTTHQRTQRRRNDTSLNEKRPPKSLTLISSSSAEPADMCSEVVGRGAARRAAATAELRTEEEGTWRPASTQAKTQKTRTTPSTTTAVRARQERKGGGPGSSFSARKTTSARKCMYWLMNPVRSEEALKTS